MVFIMDPVLMPPFPSLLVDSCGRERRSGLGRFGTLTTLGVSQMLSNATMSLPPCLPVEGCSPALQAAPVTTQPHVGSHTVHQIPRLLLFRMNHSSIVFDHV